MKWERAGTLVKALFKTQQRVPSLSAAHHHQRCEAEAEEDAPTPSIFAPCIWKHVYPGRETLPTNYFKQHFDTITPHYSLVLEPAAV